MTKKSVGSLSACKNKHAFAFCLQVTWNHSDNLSCTHFMQVDWGSANLEQASVSLESWVRSVWHVHFSFSSDSQHSCFSWQWKQHQWWVEIQCCQGLMLEEARCDFCLHPVGQIRPGLDHTQEERCTYSKRLEPKPGTWPNLTSTEQRSKLQWECGLEVGGVNIFEY